MNAATEAQVTPQPAVTLNIAERITLCVNWLARQGFEVLRVTEGTRKPRVFIRSSPLCKRLEGAIWMYQRLTSGGKKTELRYWVATYFGCEVRWNDGGAE